MGCYDCPQGSLSYCYSMESSYTHIFLTNSVFVNLLRLSMSPERERAAGQSRRPPRAAVHAETEGGGGGGEGAVQRAAARQQEAH